MRAPYYNRLGSVIAIALLVSSCSKSPTGMDGERATTMRSSPAPDKNLKSIHTSVMTLRSFPSSVGSSWTYEWKARGSDPVDTVVVRVAASIDSSAIGPVKVWVFESASGSDTLFMTVTSDTIRFFRWLMPDLWTVKLVFPIRIGSVWMGDQPAIDSCWVPAQEVVSVPAGVLRPAFRVEEFWWMPNVYGQVKTWIVPGIGVVMEDRQESERFLGSYVRRLISYEIAEDGI